MVSTGICDRTPKVLSLFSRRAGCLSEQKEGDLLLYEISKQDRGNVSSLPRSVSDPRSYLHSKY